MNLRTCTLIIVGLSLISPITPSAYAVSGKLIEALVKALTKGAGKSAPKQADELLSLGKIPKSTDEGLGLNGPLISKSLARALHNKSCPSMKLRVSLPQLNVRIAVPKNLNIRSGPGTNHQSQERFHKAGTYVVDLLKAHVCWVQVRYTVGPSQKKTGWVYSKHIRFQFDNHLTKPQKRLSRDLGAKGVYKLVARSTYKVNTPSGQGTAVAISPTVLLTNCHVLGKYDTVQILESGRSHKAVLIHDDVSEDKCFIRSLVLEVRPVPNVQRFGKIRQGERAYSIGASLGVNRSIGKGIVSGKRSRQSPRYVQTTAPISPGSSGGGLFDDKGNLLGITTFTITPGQSLNFAIAAEDFWQ